MRISCGLTRKLSGKSDILPVAKSLKLDLCDKNNLQINER